MASKSKRNPKSPIEDRPDVLGERNMTFEDFNLKKELLLGLHEMLFETPTPVQESCIPLVLKHRNVIARAKNGTGKTGSYLIPLIDLVDASSQSVQGVILVPTRELALQVSQVCKNMCKHMKVKMMATLGGVTLKEDIARIQDGVHIIVSTPSRLFSFIKNKLITLKDCIYIVLDEADKLISDDAIHAQNDLANIMSHLPSSCGRIMISATFPSMVIGFLRKFIRQFVEVNHMNELTLKNVTQFYAYLEETQKVQCLWTLYNKLRINQSIVFCNSVKRVELLYAHMTKMGVDCSFIHSKLDQQQRTQVFHDFRQGSCRHLISSDLFCRGIDVSSVNLVVNFDFPTKSSVYLHRVGRSGRYGRKGITINFITENNVESMREISKELDITMAPVPANIDEGLYTESTDPDFDQLGKDS